MRSLLRLIAAWFFFAAFAFAQPIDSLVNVSDLLKLQQLAAPAISPDGQWIVYSIKSIVEKSDKPGDYSYHTHLWLAAIDGHTAPRALTHGDLGGRSPQWNPDGTALAFVRTIKDKPQIFIFPLRDGGEAWQLTKLDQGAADPRWSPDGTRLAFTVEFSWADLRKIDPGAQPGWPIERPGRKPNDTANWPSKAAPKTAGKEKPPAASTDGPLTERREWLAQNEADANPRVTTRLNFIGEADLDATPGFSHIYTIEFQRDAEPRPITSGYKSYANPMWMPDGQHLVFDGGSAPDEHPDRDLVSDLYIAGADGKNLRTLRHLKDYSLERPRPSPDGKFVAFTADPADDPSYGQSLVGVVPIDDGEPQLLTAKLDRSAANLKWSSDGKFIYFTAASDGGFPLYRTSIGAKPKTDRLTNTDAGITGYDLGHTHLVFVRARISNPSELFAAALDAKETRLLTSHNSSWLAGKLISNAERRTLTRPDGVKFDAWIMRPANFEGGRKYPLLLEIHGGPAGMWGPGEPSMWHEFQFFASRGYGIVYCNPRGSGGYGREFQHGNFKNWGAGPSDDVLAAADLAAKETWVDSTRQVIAGGSYGGYLTAWILTRDQRFKAAVAQRGVYDLATFFGEGNAWRLVPFHFGGYPWQAEIRTILDANSPFLHAEAIKTPLLIQHGDTDLRTGVTQSEMLYKALKVLGRPVEYVRYPRATHELSRNGEPKQRLDTLVRYEEFFRRYIGEN